MTKPSRPGIIEARVRYRAAARRWRNTVLVHFLAVTVCVCEYVSAKCE
jgi:hypothetical protein